MRAMAVRIHDAAAKANHNAYVIAIRVCLKDVRNPDSISDLPFERRAQREAFYATLQEGMKAMRSLQT